MNSFKRILSMVLALCLTFALLPNTVMAANPSEVTFTATIDTPTIYYSETEDQEINLTVKVNEGAVEIDGIGATVIKDDGKTFDTSVSHPDIEFASGDYAPKSGKFGWSIDFKEASYVTTDTIMVITYTIPAGTRVGEYDLGIKKLELTYDEGWEVLVENVTVTTTLTIEEAAPAAFQLYVDDEPVGEFAPGDTFTNALPKKDLLKYDFYDVDGNAVDVGNGMMPEHDLYAVTKPDTYKLYVDGKEYKDGLLAGADISTHLSAAATAATKEGYVFNGWSFDVDVTDNKMPAQDLYATSQWKYQVILVALDNAVIGTFAAGDDLTATLDDAKQDLPDDQEFSGWQFYSDKACQNSVTVTDNKMPAHPLYLKINSKTKTFTVTWKVEGKADVTGSVEYGKTAVYPNGTPTKADTTDYTYKFIGWEDASGNAPAAAYADVTYTAQFEATCKHAKTTPVSNGDDTHDIVCANTECKAVVKDNVSCYGGTATCVAKAECSVCKTAYGKLGDHTYTKNLRGELKTPGTCSAEAVYAVKCDNCDFNSTSLSVKGEKDADNHDWYENGYTENTGATHKIVYICRNDSKHTKTSDAIEHTYVDGVCDCTATKTYTISFDTDGDGNVDEIKSAVAHGTVPVAPAFSLADTAEWDYTFTGWKDADDNTYESVPAATKDMTYTATYTSEKVKYSIQWKIGDKAVVDMVAYGEVPQYTGNTPTQTETAEYTYTFTGWKDDAGNAPVAVTKEATYIAQFEPVAKSYTITFANTGDKEMEAKSVAYGTYIGAISEPSKEGHQFTGWTITDADGNAVTITDGKMPAKNLTYTAGWQLNEYTITWKDDEGKLIDTTTVKHGETPTHADPSKAETAQYTYTFAGWTPDVVAATGETTYSATFTPVLRKYNITFKVDGKEDKVVEVNYGETPSYGSTPTKDSDTQYSYTFAGWKNSAGDVIDTLPTVSGEATYTATWTNTPVEYTVTVKIDGENVFSTTAGYDTSITYNDAVNNPTKVGHSFAGWDIELPATIPDHNVTINGTFNVNKYKITFKHYDAIWPEFKFDDIVIEKDYNAKITEDDLADVKALNDHFTGYNVTWYVLSSDTKNPFFGEGAYEYTAPDNMPAHDIEVYSYWSPEHYPFTIKSSIDNSFLKDSGFIDYNARIGSPEDLDVWSFDIDKHTPEGYTFAGYLLNDEPLKYPYIHDKTEALELVAKFEPIEYTITFMNGNEVYHEIKADFGTAVTLPEKPTNEGFTFTGWVDAEGNAADLSTMPLNGMTVYATFSVDSFKVNFFATEGDATALKSFDVPFGTKLAATVNDPATEEDETDAGKLAELLDQVADPSKEGNTWNGWNISGVPETMPAEAVNIYGTWTVNSYNVKYYVDGELVHTDSVNYGESIPVYTYTPEAGYTFSGWGNQIPATMPADDVEVNGTTTPISYTITFDTTGGEPNVIAPITKEYKSSITKPADPSKIGHTFLGWSTDSTKEAIIEFPETMPAEDLHLYAVWQRNTIYITWIIDGKETIVPYEYGDTITVPEAAKADDAKWTYKFTGWKNAAGETVEIPETATAAETYTAQFAEDQAVEYNVKFINGENALYETKIAWNGKVTLDGFEAPTETGKTLSWTVEGADVSFPYAMTTADVTFVAKWTPNPYTITVDGVEYASTYGADVSIADPAPQEGKTFTGWTVTKTEDGTVIDAPAKMPAYDITYTSNWTVNTYTLTVSSFDANGVPFEETYHVDYGEGLSGYYLETPSYTDNDGTLYEFDNWSVWTWQNDDDNTMAEYTGTTMPASNVKMYSTYTYTGWCEFVPGFTSYAVKSDIAHYRDEWATIEGARYYFVFVDDAMYSYIVKDITLYDGSYYAFDHASGKFLADTTGIYKATNGDLYWIENGVAVANKGLVRLVEDGEVHYYYFGNADNAYIAVKAGVYWVNNTNDLLPMWDYTFGEDGVIAHDDALNNNAEQTHKVVSYDDGKYYTIDGIKVHYGLFIGDDGEYYYARSSGQLVANQNYWISESHLNGVERDGIPVEEGSYKFDAEGRIVWSSDLKNGIYAEDGGLYYYEDGVRTYAGLIELNGNIYYVRTSGQLAVGRYWVTKNNGIMASASYEFDQDGKMIRTNGLINEPDGLFYYVNGNRYHAGLIKYEGDFYYIRTNGQAVTGRTYWISHLNGYDVTDGIKEGSYEFTADGKMIIPEPVVLKNGIHEEDGKLMYYVDGKLNYAGLIQYTGTMTKEDGTEVNYDGAWIYVRTSGELAVGRSYWATKNNGYMKSATYQFDENGIMLNPPV